MDHGQNCHTGIQEKTTKKLSSRDRQLLEDIRRMEKMFDSRAGIEGVVVIVDREEK